MFLTKLFLLGNPFFFVESYTEPLHDQNHELKRTLQAKGPGHSPSLVYQIFRTGPCIWAALWCGLFGLAHRLPQGLPLACYMLEQPLSLAYPMAYPMAYPWPSPGLALA